LRRVVGLADLHGVNVYRFLVGWFGFFIVFDWFSLLSGSFCKV
jgi:hypothetical protein